MADNDIEIAKQDGREFRSVRLQLQADGAIRMHAYDNGPTAKLTFGREDYEFWVTIPPDMVPKLALELLRAQFSGRLQAVTELRDFCKKHEIANEFGTWT